MKQLVEDLFSLADVRVNGNRPWDITVHDERFYNHLKKIRNLSLANPIWMVGGIVNV